jgi:hypothetical protein
MSEVRRRWDQPVPQPTNQEIVHQLQLLEKKLDDANRTLFWVKIGVVVLIGAACFNVNLLGWLR